MNSLTGKFGQAMNVSLRQLLENFAPSNLAASGRQLILPFVGILVFVGFWHLAAPQVNTSLGTFPGPAQVWEQAGQLWQEHSNQRAKADRFITMQEQRNARILADNPDAEVRIR
ncbi:MAG: ABC transporter permease, partial [Gammaproteobacteria bacterium]|nr:ABC transporter permease [Gammaproteobacteria bacterium]